MTFDIGDRVIVIAPDPDIPSSVDLAGAIGTVLYVTGMGGMLTVSLDHPDRQLIPLPGVRPPYLRFHFYRAELRKIIPTREVSGLLDSPCLSCQGDHDRIDPETTPCVGFADELREEVSQ